MNDSNLFTHQLSTLKKFFTKIFNSKSIHQIARKTKFIKRSTSKINGFELVNTLLESALDPKIYPLEGLAEGMTRYNSDAEMTKQALSQRINTSGCVDFFESIFKECLSHIIHKISPKITALTSLKGTSLLNLFNKIIVIDCTEFPLHSTLHESFKGSGGPQENASAMRIFAALELKTNCIFGAKLTDRRTTDQVLGPTFLPILEKNDLILFDLGFFSFNFFKQIQEKQSFYISRLHGRVNVYHNALETHPIELGKFIEKKLKNKDSLNISLYMGAEKILVRLIAFKLNKKTSEKGIKDYLKRCRKDKRSPSEENLERLKYAIFITNIPFELVSPLEIATLYRIRWQIELIFKNWKSQLNIDFLSGKNPNRIKTLVLSRLILISVLWMLSGSIQMHLEIYYDEELSMHKCINWMKRGQRFINLFLGQLDKFLHEFLKDARKWLCKEYSQKKQTTRQKLYSSDDEYLMYY